MTEGVLFDLDGTLLDTLQDLTDSTNYALRSFGCPERSLAEIRSFVGNGALRQITLALPGLPDDPPAEQVLSVYKTYYGAHCADATAPYAGIPEMLAVLRGRYALGIVTNKPARMTESLCGKWFPGVFALGESPALPRKPAADMLLHTMRELDVARCVYVGDSEVDVLTAKNAGLPCIGVTWGFRDADVLRRSGATYICTDVRNLPAQIEKILGEYHGK